MAPDRVEGFPHNQFQGQIAIFMGIDDRADLKEGGHFRHASHRSLKPDLMEKNLFSPSPNLILFEDQIETNPYNEKGGRKDIGRGFELGQILKKLAGGKTQLFGEKDHRNKGQHENEKNREQRKLPVLFLQAIEVPQGLPFLDVLIDDSFLCC